MCINNWQNWKIAILLKIMKIKNLFFLKINTQRAQTQKFLFLKNLKNAKNTKISNLLFAKI